MFYLRAVWVNESLLYFDAPLWEILGGAGRGAGALPRADGLRSKTETGTEQD